MKMKVRIAYLFFLSAWIALSQAASPPSYLIDGGEASNRVSSIKLRAPRHDKTKRELLDHESIQKSALSIALHKHRRSALVLPSRRSVGQSANNLTQSSSNPNDKLQSIGFLGGAYDIPLNLSSDPAQLVFVQLDTGSSDLWIASSSCSSSQCNDDTVLKFDPTKSTTFRNVTVPADTQLNVTSILGNNSATNLVEQNFSSVRKRQSGATTVQIPFSIEYSDSTIASGYLASENITISNLGVSEQIFALINSTNVTLAAQGISGVMGLGFPRGSTISRSLIGQEDELGGARTLPLITSLLQNSGESYPLFGLYLTQQGGRATFGAVDPMVLPTEEDRSLVEWYDVVPFPSGDTSQPSNNTLNLDAPALDSYVQWVIHMTGAGVGGRAATIAPTYNQVGSSPLALLDSGTSAMVGPAAGVESLFAQITNARHVGGGRFVVPCDTTDRMYFSFGGRNITLLPSDYIIGPDSTQTYLCFAWPAAAQPDSTGVDWILGTPFLRAVYSLYSIGIDYVESPKIGLYPLRQPADATASSVIFAPQPTASLSSYLANQATTIASNLPNSLVTLSSPSSVPYFFSNATATLSPGVPPTRVGAPSTYSPLIATGTSTKSFRDLPVIASSSSPLPVPSNPAATGAHNAAIGSSPPRAALLTTLVVFCLIAAL